MTGENSSALFDDNASVILPSDFAGALATAGDVDDAGAGAVLAALVGAAGADVGVAPLQAATKARLASRVTTLRAELIFLCMKVPP